MVTRVPPGLWPLAACFLVACAKLWGFDDLKGGGAGGQGVASAGASSTFCGNRAPCALGCTDCGNLCVDLTSDPNNCGACQTQCTSGRTCQASQCLCPPETTLCSGICKNLSNDADNCGQCALGCDGGVCGAAACSYPTAIATAQDSPGAIAVDDSNVYWSVTTGIVSMPVAGGDVTPLGVPGGASALLADANNLYWAAAGVLYEMPKAGGTVLQLVSGSVGAIALDSTRVYFTRNDPQTTLGDISSVPIAGGNPTAIVSAVASGTIAVTADTLYYGAYGQIYATPLSGGSQTPFLSVSAYAMLFKSPYLYISMGSAIDEIIAGRDQLVVTAQKTASDFATDNNTLYFLDSRSADATLGMAVYSAKLTHVVDPPNSVAPEATRLAIAFDPSPQRIAVDATSVYWTSLGHTSIDGAVYRITK